MATFVRALRRVVFPLVLAGVANAQWFASTASCDGPLITTGAPKINTCPTIATPAAVPAATFCVMLIGTVSLSPFCLPLPFACAPTCLLCCLPIVDIPVIAPGPLTLCIPNDNFLVGKSFCMQSVCLQGTCLTSSDELNVTITC